MKDATGSGSEGKPAADAVTCPLCGASYGVAEGQACHSRCPLERGCQLLACPHCGYEVPAPSRLTRWLARWLVREKRAD
jgi:hypothetical protein